MGIAKKINNTKNNAKKLSTQGRKQNQKVLSVNDVNKKYFWKFFTKNQSMNNKSSESLFTIWL